MITVGINANGQQKRRNKMGMFTELVIKADVLPNLPDGVARVLNILFNPSNIEIIDLAKEDLPDHPFFEATNWFLIGSCSSYYHIPWTSSGYDKDYLFSRSDLKNYHDEIGLFIDWISPYLRNKVGTCIGYRWYEEDKIPTLIYRQGTK